MCNTLGDRKACTRCELEWLVRLLNHACKVVQPGRTFLWSMIDLLTATGADVACYPHHHICLNREFRVNLAWWCLFLKSWNGVGLLGDYRLSPGEELTLDASGTWGYGAWSGTSWFQYSWSEEAQDQYIVVKELISIVIAVAVWGCRSKGHSIMSYCDNTVVVAVLNAHSCQDKHLMHLLRCLFFCKAYWRFSTRGKHIAGSCNCRADDLSRNDLPAFRSKVSGADSHPTYAYTGNTDQAPAFAGTALDISDLDSAVQEYFAQGLGLSYQQTYKATLKCFHEFCVKFAVCNPFPTVGKALVLFHHPLS